MRENEGRYREWYLPENEVKRSEKFSNQIFEGQNFHTMVNTTVSSSSNKQRSQCELEYASAHPTTTTSSNMSKPKLIHE